MTGDHFEQHTKRLGLAMPTAETEKTSRGRSKVLILCTGNSARSQMAEGLLRHDAGDFYEVYSAGTHPSTVRVEAIAVMKESGIDISGHRSKSVEEFSGRAFDFVITVCDNARESCPVFPAGTKRIHWSIEDPAAVESSTEDRLAAFRQARDELRERLSHFVHDQNSGAADHLRRDQG